MWVKLNKWAKIPCNNNNRGALRLTLSHADGNFSEDPRVWGTSSNVCSVV